jgi:hypothetical protein
MPVRLPVRCSILLSFRKLLPAFFWLSTGSFSVHQNPEIYLQKRNRAAFAGGPSQGGNALGGQQQRGAIADLVLQIKKSRALTGLNLCSRFFCSRYFTQLTRRTVMPITSAGVHTTPGLTDTLFQEGCSHDPDRFRSKTAVYAGSGNNDARQGTCDLRDVT